MAPAETLIHEDGSRTLVFYQRLLPGGESVAVTLHGKVDDAPPMDRVSHAVLLRARNAVFEPLPDQSDRMETVIGKQDPGL